MASLPLHVSARATWDEGPRRDPEDRPARDPRQIRDKMLDKTIADSFPASDPPSSLPDPDGDSFTDAA